MTGAPESSSSEQPETHPLPDEADELALTMNEWEALQVGSGPDSDNPVQQSVFSARSGIHDLLVKSDAADPAMEALESETADPEVIESAEPAKPQTVPSPGRNRRSRLAKSKRNIERARRRQKNYLEKRREQKKRMVFYGRIRLIFKLCFAVLLGALLWEAVQSPFWNFSAPRYTMHDQTLLRPAQVAALVQPWVGKPIYAVDTGKISDAIEHQYGIVEKAAVRRRLFPARLDITIAEKQPWAELYTDDKATKPYGLLAPDDGVLSLEEYQYRPDVYRGLERIIIPPHTQVQKALLDRLQEIAWQARQIPGLHLFSVDARNPEMIVLNYQEIPVILGRPDNGVPERLARLGPLVPKINELHDGLLSVDLRWEQQVTFHTKPNIDLGLKPQEPTQG